MHTSSLELETVLFTRNTELTERLRAVKPPEGMVLTFNAYEKFSRKSADKAHILIADAALLPERERERERDCSTVHRLRRSGRVVSHSLPAHG